MSNYTVTTNFLSKDSLPSGNTLKLVKGAELTTEFNAIAVAVNSKFDGSVAFAPDGTAAQPSFGFTSVAGTGMFNAAGVLGWATSNTSRVTINTLGNVIVNAPTSGTALQISGALASQTLAINNNTATPVLISNATGGAVFAGIVFGAAANSNLGGGITSQAISANSGTISLQYVVGGSLTTGLTIDTAGNVNVPNGTGLGPVYSGIPQNVQGGAYTLVLGDANKQIRMTGAGLTLTIPANASVAFPIGATISINNGNAAALPIAITTDTLVISGTTTTGTRSLAVNGLCTIVKTTATQWNISGPGLT